MNKRKLIPVFAMSASAILSTIGHGSWIFSDIKEREREITTSPAEKVCYIADEPNVFYTAVEKALQVANDKATESNNKTVVVIPSLNASDKTTPKTFIKDIDGDGEVTIGDYVSLTIACTEDDAKNGTYAHPKTSNSSLNSRFADSEEDFDKYVKNNIGLASGTTLNINTHGSLNIGGYTGTGQGNQTPTGHTVQDFAQLTMFDNSAIQCSGTLNCYGYIKEYSSDTEIYANSGAIFNLPFVVYDYRGGSYSYGASQNTDAPSFPFNIFDFPNIQSRIHFFYGATLKGFVTVYAQDTFTYQSATAFGDGGLFKISNGGEVSWKYQSPSRKYSYVYNIDNNINNIGKNYISKTKVDVIKGEFTVSAMTVDVGLSIATSDYFLPIPYKYDIEVQKGASINIAENVKFLSGSSLLIDEGARATFSKGVAFYQRYVDEVTTGTRGTNVYPQTLGPAKLLNDGSLTINSSFSGYVSRVNSKTATVTTGPSSSFDLVTNEVLTGARGSKFWEKLTVKGDYKQIHGYGFGDISDDTSVMPSKRQFAKGSSYKAKTDLNGTDYWLGSATGSQTVTEVVPTAKSGSYSSQMCLLSTAKILMADGSFKMAGQVVPGDIVISFNHENGTLEPNAVLINDDIAKEEAVYEVIHLQFTDGVETDFVYEHGFFDVTLNKYVYFHADNYAEFIGHQFVVFKNADSKGTATLLRVITNYVRTKVCSPATAKHLNIVSDGLLSMPGGLNGLFNIFEYDRETLAFDMEKKTRDIEKYGLLGYDAFERFFPRELYNLLPCEYLGVSIGKGLITWEIIEDYVNRWKSQLMEIL